METLVAKGLTKIAILGNPNVGKSSIFNQLTGLSQKVGNYPGVTVDKTKGIVKKGKKKFELIDLPGTYSLYPKSEDEVVAHRVLNGLDENEKPDFVLVILDACNLERSLLLGTQVMDLGIPMAFVINMIDLAEKKGIKIKTFELYKALGIPLILTDARNNKGIESIRTLIFDEKFEKPKPFLDMTVYFPEGIQEELAQEFGKKSIYQFFQLLNFSKIDKSIASKGSALLDQILRRHKLDLSAIQVAETESRYQKISNILKDAIQRDSVTVKSLTLILDRFLIHPIAGYFIFLMVMLLVFQAIFAWASYPMDWIDGGFANLSSFISENLPSGVLTDLMAEGIIPGIGGVLIFIPQIALLFGFLAFL